MSTFVVSENHIQSIVGFASKYQEFSCQELDRLCNMLMIENIKSYGYRYSDEEVSDILAFYQGEGAMRFDSKYAFSRLVKPLEAYKAVECYQYQACEHTAWEKSEAKEFTDKVLRRALSEYFRQSEEYNAIPWGIS